MPPVHPHIRAFLRLGFFALLTGLASNAAAQTTPTGFIGDSVYFDLDGNGNQGAREPGIGGVTVQLWDETEAHLLATTTTDAWGHYSFQELSDGTYVILLINATLPGEPADPLSNTGDPGDGLDQPGSGDSRSTVLISGGSQNLDQDFGYRDVINPNTIGGTLWSDSNADGIQSGDEAGRYAGVTVVLRNAGGVEVSSATTDQSGSFRFPGLPNGTYSIDVTDLAGVLEGWTHTVGDQDATTDASSKAVPFSITVADGQTLDTIDLGYDGADGTTATLGDWVWHDVNGDGRQDPDGADGIPGTGDDEPGLPHVPVTLTISYPDGTVTQVTTLTDASGHYRFGGLLLDAGFDGSGIYGPGGNEPAHTLRVIPPPGFVGSPSHQGTSGEDSGNVLGEPAFPTKDVPCADADFGLMAGGAIDGYVYLEADAIDGLTAGDTPLPGVDIVITDALMNAVVVTTDAQGYFSLATPPGYTKLDIVNADLPSGAAGADDPSLAVVSVGSTVRANAAYSLPPLPAATGLAEGRVFIDNDGNRLFGVGDTALPGINVSLGNTTTTLAVTTDASGSFAQEVAVGEWTVDVEKPESLSGDPLVSRGADSVLITVSEGAVARISTGYTSPPGFLGTVMGRVYEDKDTSGTFTAADVPQGGVTVKITASDASAYWLVTAPDGSFSQQVPPGLTTVDVQKNTLTGIPNPRLTTNLYGDGRNPSQVTVAASEIAVDNTGYQNSPAAGGQIGYFQATRPSPTSVTLAWATLVEYDTLGYKLYRSWAGGEWTAIESGTVLAKGTGTSIPQSYLLTDSAVPYDTRLEYRLMKVKLTGAESYLEVAPLGDTPPSGGGPLNPPTAVRLSSFSAARNAANHIDLTWNTLVEYDLLGFRLHRRTPEGSWETVAPGLIPSAAGGTYQPETYRLTDDPLGSFGPIEYRLTVVELDGRERVLAETTAASAHRVDINLTAGQLLLDVTGQPHARLILETSAGVADSPWIPIRSLDLGAKGTGAFSVPLEPDKPIGFFRLRARIPHHGEDDNEIGAMAKPRQDGEQ